MTLDGTRNVLDASALLCLLRGEAGADRVARALPQSVILAVNYSEVVAKLTDAGVPDDVIDQMLDPLKLEIIPFSKELARSAGRLRRQTRAQGLSLGDRACLALAQSLGAVALTADRAWCQVKDVDVAVDAIR